MKKNNNLSKILFIGSFVAIVINGCTTLKSHLAICDCKFRIAEIGGISYDPLKAPDKLGISLNVDCYNPNKTVEAILEKLDFNLFINDSKTAMGMLENKLKVPPTKTVQFPINIQLSLSKIGNTIFEVIQSGSANYELKGKAYFSTLLGESAIPVTISKGKWSGE